MLSAENFTHSVKCLSLMSTIRRPSLIHNELTVHIRIIVIGIVWRTWICFISKSPLVTTAKAETTTDLMAPAPLATSTLLRNLYPERNASHRVSQK